MTTTCQAIDDLRGHCDYQAEYEYETSDGHTRRLCGRHYVQVQQAIQFAALLREYRIVLEMQEESA